MVRKQQFTGGLRQPSVTSFKLGADNFNNTAALNTSTYTDIVSITVKPSSLFTKTYDTLMIQINADLRCTAGASTARCKVNGVIVEPDAQPCKESTTDYGTNSWIIDVRQNQQYNITVSMLAATGTPNGLSNVLEVVGLIEVI